MLTINSFTDYSDHCFPVIFAALEEIRFSACLFHVGGIPPLDTTPPMSTRSIQSWSALCTRSLPNTNDNCQVSFQTAALSEKLVNFFIIYVFTLTSMKTSLSLSLSLALTCSIPFYSGRCWIEFLSIFHHFFIMNSAQFTSDDSVERTGESATNMPCPLSVFLSSTCSDLRLRKNLCLSLWPYIV